MDILGVKRLLWDKKALLSIFLIALILLFYALFLSHRIDLTVADIGRHLRNGEFLLKDAAVRTTNFYSYTVPDYPVPNHHWLSGLFFFGVWRLGGFPLLHLIFIGLALTTLFIFLRLAWREAGSGPAALLGFLTLPLLAERTEIRPEIFSYFFSAIFFWLLLRYKDRGNRLSLLALPILELVWVNSHIYFFLGLFLIVLFLIGAAVARPFDRKKVLPLVWILLATAVATLLNPSFLRGAVAPFTIFQNYGYRLAENQPVWFLEKLLINPNFAIFKILFGLLAASFLARLILDRRILANIRSLAINIGLGTLVSVMGWLAARNFALFGFFFIPLAAGNLAACCRPWLAAHSRLLAAGAAGIISILIIPAFFGHWQRYFPYWREGGIGLESDNGRSAEFFREQGLRGPIFNNYDIGGYLIWHLFPQEQVFVDNRPEAYPAEFFTETYVPMQEKEEAWQNADDQWGFNAIFFSHRDMTPWGQQFLIARLNDPQWAPVFADRYAIIFLKRNEENRPVIERFEIPQGAFRVVAR